MHWDGGLLGLLVGAGLCLFVIWRSPASANVVRLALAALVSALVCGALGAGAAALACWMVDPTPQATVPLWKSWVGPAFQLGNALGTVLVLGPAYKRARR